MGLLYMFGAFVLFIVIGMVFYSLRLRKLCRQRHVAILRSPCCHSSYMTLRARTRAKGKTGVCMPAVE